MKRTWLGGALVALLVAAPHAPAQACGGDACEPDPAAQREPVSFLETLMPGAGVQTLRLAKGAEWHGVGFNITLAAWARPRHRSGAIGVQAAALASGNQDGRVMSLWRCYLEATFERDLERRFLIPYWSAGTGSLNETALGKHTFVDGSVGIHLLRSRSVIVDLEYGLLLPFDAADRLAGRRAEARLTLGAW